MRDYVASFYGGYDELGFRPHSALHVPWAALAIGVATVTLVAFVVGDVHAYESRPAVVEVTSVGWYGEGYLLTTAGGFTVHASESVIFALTCSSLCLPWVGANVSAPFQFVAFSIAYHGLQYTNVTVKAPATHFYGSVAIALRTD